MTTTQETRLAVVPSVEDLREALGHSHYERMRLAMRPTLDLDDWPQLPEESREAYRQRTDYLVPALTQLLWTATL